MTSTTKKIALTALLISLPFGANAMNSQAEKLMEEQQASYQEKRDGIEYRFKNFREKYPELVTELSAKERTKRDRLHERREARINSLQHINKQNWEVAGNSRLDNMIASKDNNRGFKTLVLSQLGI